MEPSANITRLIEQWPTRRAFAADIGAQVAAVHKWASANRVPAQWQMQVVLAARRRGLVHVTAEWMLMAHDTSPARRAPGAKCPR